MDNSRSRIRKCNKEVKQEELKMTEEDVKLQEVKSDQNEKRYIWGWDDAIGVANDMWSAGNMRLLEGKLLFAFKNTSVTSKSDLYQIVLVANPEVDPETGYHFNRPDGTFGISLTTIAYSELLPRVPIEYLENILLPELESKFKINKEAVTTLSQIIEDFKKL